MAYEVALTPEEMLEYGQPNSLRIPAAIDGSSYGLAAIICTASALIFMFFSTDVLHWFLLPTIISGTLIGSDAIEWIRGRMDTFDPKGLIGLYGIHFFCIGTMLHVTVGTRFPYATNPEDMRTWYGWMGIINVFGILIYKAVERRAQRGAKPFKKIWTHVPGRTSLVLLGGILAAVICHVFVFTRLGGVAGVLESYETSILRGGLGIPQIVATGLPLLCMFAVTVYFRAHANTLAGPLATIVVAVGCAFIHILVQGLSRSRGDVIITFFWLLVIVHYFWRPVTRKTVLVLMVPLILLLWMYSFYKQLGSKVFAVAGAEGTTMGTMVQEARYPIAEVFLGDLVRSDVHAYILWKTTRHDDTYDLRYGKTYLGAFGQSVPYWIWRNKPRYAEKVLAGSEMFHGKGWFKSELKYSSHAYGIVGEAMLNFGFLAAPFAFALFGFFVGRFRRYVRGLHPTDLRFLLVPYGIWLLINLLAWDMDNYFAHTLARASVAILIVFLMTGKARLSPATSQGGQYE